MADLPADSQALRFAAVQPLAPGEVVAVQEKKEGIERFLKGALAHAPAAGEGVMNQSQSMGNQSQSMGNQSTTTQPVQPVTNQPFQSMNEQPLQSMTPQSLQPTPNQPLETPATNDATQLPTDTPLTVPPGFHSFHVAPIHGLFETPPSYHFSQAPDPDETDETDEIPTDRFVFSLTEEKRLQETAVALAAKAAQAAKEREEQRKAAEEQQKRREQKAAEERAAREKEAQQRREEARKKEAAAREAQRKREEAQKREAQRKAEEERRLASLKRQVESVQAAAVALQQRLDTWQRRMEGSLSRASERVAALHDRVDAETACWRVLVAVAGRSYMQGEVRQLAAQRQRKRLREAAKRRRIEEGVSRCCVDGHISDGTPRPCFHFSPTKLPVATPSPRALAASLAASLEKRGMRAEVAGSDATATVTASLGVSATRVVITRVKLPGDAGWWDAAQQSQWMRSLVQSLTQMTQMTQMTQSTTQSTQSMTQSMTQSTQSMTHTPVEVIAVAERGETAHRLLAALALAAPGVRVVAAGEPALERTVVELLERPPERPRVRAGELLRQSLEISGGARLSAGEAERVAEIVRRRVALPAVEAGSGAEMLLRCEEEAMNG